MNSNVISGFPLIGWMTQQRLVKDLRRKLGLKKYLSKNGYGLHYGAFATFEEARRWLPPNREFSNPEFSDEYADHRTKSIFGFDYPMMFWLQKAFQEGADSIFDIGGSVGVHYYAYSRFLEYSDSLKWEVYELAASVERGRAMAESENVRNLTFTTKLDPSTIEADVWMAAGAIEFLEKERLERLLSATVCRPRHVLLNKLPLYDGDDYVSTQNIGNGSFTPHHVFNRRKYIADVEACGYRLVDTWPVLEREFGVPGNPEQSFRHYSGLYFRAV